jgi:hypothetical protein
MTLNFAFHMVLHLAVPAIIAWVAYRVQFKKAFLIMLAGITIDIDHLLVTPILDPDRCSVGFHVLHSYWMCAVYLLLTIIPKTRLIGLGLLIHIVLDSIECFRQFYLEDLLKDIQTELLVIL